jgi:peptidoglycan/LPS O-acetylase OafA/YrhL
MLLLFQIALTVWACIAYNKAGQKWGKGLIPMVCTFFIGALAGAIGEMAFTTIADVGCIIWLGVLIATVKPVKKGD